MAETCGVRTALEPVRRSSREKKQNVCSMYEYDKISLSSKKQDRIPVSPDGRNTRSSTDNYGRKQKNISAKHPRLKQQRYEKSSRKCVEASQTSVKEVFGDEIHKSGTKTSSWVTGPVGREESPMFKCCPESPGAGRVSVASQAECGIPWGPSQQDVPVGGRKQQAVSAGAKGLHDVSAEAKDQQDVPVGGRKQQAVSAGAKGLHDVSAEAKDQQDVPVGGRKQQAVSAGAKGLHDVSAEAKEQQDVPVGAREQVVRSDEMSDEVQEARLIETGDPECKDLLVAKLQLSPVKMSETDTHAGNQLGKKIVVNAYSDRSSDSPTKVISGSERSSLTTNCVLQRRKSDRNHQKKNVDESCLTDSFLSLNEYEVSRIQSPSEYASKTPVRSSEDEKDQDGSFLIKKGTQNFRRKRSVSTKYFCSYCGKVFVNQSLLVTHERCHSGEKPYPCSICGQRFALKSNMHQHKQLHSEDRPFMCEVCGKCFKTGSYCREHSKTHLAVKSYKCEVADCGKTFSSKSNHQAHMLFHRGEKPYDCKHCHRTFRRKQALKKHLLVHSGIKKFECLSCGKTFVQQGSYHAHVLLHEKKPFSCGVCKKFFASEEKRESHQLLHTRYPFYNCEFCHRNGMNFQDLSKHLKKHGLQILRNIKCPDCRRSFTTQNIFEQHTAVMSLTCSACGVSLNSACVYYSHRKSHRNDPHVQHDHILGHVCDVCGKDFQKISLLKNHKLIHGDTRFRCDTCGKESKTKPCHMAHVKTHSGLKPFCCEVCGKYFVSHTNLQNHQLIHTGEKPHCCHICSKSFRTRALLREHGNVHCNEKRFKCELCGKEYTSRTNYINHLNVHKGQRNYECEHCGKKFFAKYVMRKHIQIHTGQKNYQCDFCGKKFIQHGNWLIHRRSHTGERPHRCQQCPACFVNSSQLKSHRKRVHDQKKEEMCDKCFKHFYDRKGLLSHMKNVHVRKENGEIFSCNKCDKLFVSKENYRAHEGVCKVSKKPLPRLQPSILQSVLRTVYSKAGMSSYGVKEDVESMQPGQLLQEKDFLFQFESVKVKKDKELDRDTELPDQSLPRAAQQFHLQSLPGVDNDPACLAGDNIEIVEISEAVIEADLSSPKVEVREDASIAPLGLGQAVVDTEMGPKEVREDASVSPVDMGQAVVDTEMGPTEVREDASVSPVDMGQAVVDTEIGPTEVRVDASVSPVDMGQAVVDTEIGPTEVRVDASVSPVDMGQAVVDTEIGPTEVRVDASVSPVDMGQAVVDTEIGPTEVRVDASVSPVDMGQAVVDTEIGLTEEREEELSLSPVNIGQAVVDTEIGLTEEREEELSVSPVNIGQAVVDTEIGLTEEREEELSLSPVNIGQAVVDTEIGPIEEREEELSVSPVNMGPAVVDTEIGLTEVEVSDAVVELTLHEVEIKLEADVLKSTVQPLQRPQAQKGTESVGSTHLAYSKESTERIKSCSVGNEVMGNTRTESLHRCDIVNLGSKEPLQGATVADAGTLSSKETNDTQRTRSFHVAAKITEPSASWTMSRSSSMFQCDLCKKVLVSGREAMLHEKLHQADLLYQCSLCGVRFGTAASLTSHLQTHSQVQGHQENTAADGGRSTYIHSEGSCRGMTRIQNYSCDICHKGFSFIGLFKLHTESHRVSCCFKCYRCGRIFQDRRIFDCHIQSHSGKGFKCGACGKMFSMEAVLKIHQKRHSCHCYSPKMIKNSTCPLQHAKNDGLKMRFNEHGAIRSSSDAVTPPLRTSNPVTLVPVDRENISGIVPMCMCGVCDATYSREEDLVRHQQVHMAGVKYLCQICDLHFDKEVAFRNHIKLHGEVGQVGMGNTECG
ncbi:uncharacterized protein LOC124115187 isoform X3 [Haliotis rufescens]|uniref:uncharacterized protein LOC124115187 isoform X3 n=1 Tax=Haliotis rufescens TaxID=6454 RepID=UPI00201F47AE|nr:uncharacterized protein LOC124115187 isoform X3 [Haliotis rufescens]